MEKLSKLQKKFWKKLTEPYLNLRIHDTASLIKVIDYCQAKNIIVNSLTEYFITTADDFIKKTNIPGCVEKTDLKQTLIKQLIISYKHFKSSNSQRPVIYLEQVCSSCFRSELARTKKQLTLKKEYYEYLKNSNSTDL